MRLDPSNVLFARLGTQHSSLSEEPTQEQKSWTPFLFF